MLFTPEGMAAMRRIWDSEQRQTRWQVGSSEVVWNALNQDGAGMLGPYGSLFVAGFCCKYTLERAIKGYSIKGGSSMLPMESWLKNQVNDGAKLLEAIFDSDGDTWDNMLDAAGRWMSDSNSVVRDLRKIYRYRVKGEKQKK